MGVFQHNRPLADIPDRVIVSTMPPSKHGNTLINEIDEGTLVAKRHAVIRALQAHIAVDDDDVRELIQLQDGLLPTDPIEFVRRIWRKIEALPLTQQGALRLCVGLANPDADLEWYEAEYFILWSREQGVSEEHIGRAFRTARNRS